MNIRTWYGGAIKMPKYDTHSLQVFAVSCLGLVKTLCGNKLNQEVSVSFMKGGTAAAVIKEGRIFINSDLLRGYLPCTTHVPPVEDMMGVLLGLTVHEAAHFAYSPEDLSPFALWVKEHTHCTYDEALALTLGNLIEDVFIEAEAVRNAPSFEWMLETMNRMILTDEEHWRRNEEVVAQEDAPESMAQVIAVVNYLIYAKVNEISVNCTDYVDGLFRLVRGAVDMGVLQQRLDLCLQVYELLMENVPSSEDSSREKKMGELIQRVVGMTADRMGKKPKRLSEERGTLGRMMDELENTTVTSESTGEDEEGGENVLYYERSVPPEFDPVGIDQKYLSLAEFARQRATVNKPYGLAQKRGHTMRGLYRIATDSKIFAEIEPMREYKPMQVIILVDFSGSMSADVGDTDRITLAIQAAAGAAYGLAEGRCEVAVYGHTADRYRQEDGGDVVIYRFKGFSDPVTYLTKTLGCEGEGYERIENRDGFAIRYVAKKFNATNKRKVLLVISDGSPMANEYGGHMAIQHTKRCIEQVRQKGIDVLSISITSETSKINARMYGAQWNVFNEDPNVIEQIVKSLIGGTM